MKAFLRIEDNKGFCVVSHPIPVDGEPVQITYPDRKPTADRMEVISIAASVITRQVEEAEETRRVKGWLHITKMGSVYFSQIPPGECGSALHSTVPIDYTMSHGEGL